MNRKIRLLALALAVFGYQPRSFSQAFSIATSILDGEGGYSWKWDSVQDKLILYRDLTDSAAPAARIFQSDGTSVAMYPLKDLPGARYIDVWGAAATPEGGVVLASIVGYSPRATLPPQLKQLLLTYDGAGKLTKVWNVNPYHHHFLAVDREGDVFALGDSSLKNPYPLVIKYSPSGAVSKEFLSTAMLAQGPGALSYGSPTGDPEMFIKGDYLYVWMGSSQELFKFSLGGDLLSRIPLSNGLAKLTAATGSDRVKVRSLTVGDRDEITAQVQLWPKVATDPVRTILTSVSADGSNATLLVSPSTPGWFLGRSSQRKLIFLEPKPGLQGGMLAEY